MLIRSICLDEFCKCPIIYPDNSQSVSCRHCGQTHNVANFTHSSQLDDKSEYSQTILKNALLNLNHILPKGPEMVSTDVCAYIILY